MKTNNLDSKKIIIFGAGHYGKLALEHYGEKSVKFFCDNNPEKIGKTYCRKKIISFEQLKEIHSDYQIVIATEKHYPILNQFFQNGIKSYINFILKETIIPFSKTEIKPVCVKIKESKMEMNYFKNKNLLSNYPYLFGEIPKFRFLQSKTLNMDEEIPYFFKDLHKPIFIRNLSHPVHIKFLFDNVRASEDVVMDNHIYLYYENEQTFLEMLCQCDLKQLLKQQKFVFLAGKQNKDIYPIDFREKYGIDYASMKFKPLRANELKRIVIYQGHESSGQDCLFQVSAANRNILSFFCPYPFTLLPKLKNEILKFKFDIKDLFYKDRPPIDYYSLSNPEIFRFISMILYNNKDQRERISPTILFDPHAFSYSQFGEVYRAFQYRKSVKLIRNPIMRLASITKSKDLSSYLRSNGFRKTFWVEEAFVPLYNSFSVFGKSDKLNCFKLESLKKNPMKAAKALCKYFQVPFDRDMLHPEKFPYIEVIPSVTGKKVMGFEPTPKRNIFESISKWDLQRLMPIFEPILQYYGYKYKKYAPLKEEDLRKIYSEPFKFDKLISDRDLFTESMLYLYNFVKSGEYWLPPFIDID
jgi:hypothetical protein